MPSSPFLMEVKSAEPDQTIDSIDSLFNTILTLCILIFLYFPTIFKNLLISPVFIFTLILLAYLLRLGAIQRQLESTKSIEPQKQQITDLGDENYIWDFCDFNSEVEYDRSSFVEWNVKAPLEIIYEAYEGEEEEDEDGFIGNRENRVLGNERYHALSLYYPESDSDSSSDGEFDVVRIWESPENGGFRWDEAGEELIEIEIDGKRRQIFNEEEDNLIEIDISPGRSNEFSAIIK